MVQAEEQKLWYGRDILGRRSLLWQQTSAKAFTLCSVGRRTGIPWQEVGTGGIYCYCLKSASNTLFPWSLAGDIYNNALARSYPNVNTEVPCPSVNCADRSQAYYAEAVSALQEKLLQAMRVRVDTIPGLHLHSSTSRVAVMYSGGVDCAVIARLLHEVLPSSASVDLLNVSFENPRSIANARKVDSSFTAIYDTPDRITGIQGYHELCETCPTRDWRFVCINVPYAEVLDAKESVLDLMYPNDSIMDYSIALAFYFCARGRGYLMQRRNVVGHEGSGREQQEEQRYETAAKVFFSGLGADEQLGGYSRHAAAYKSGSWSRLISELQCDLDRIPSRNLGRDDRILSHFAREVRWPFLDENVVTFLCSLRVDAKMSFELQGGGGDKIILRDLARRIGIPQAAAEKKRAVQFGSRSARMDVEHGKSDRVKGHQRQH